MPPHPDRSRPFAGWPSLREEPFQEDPQDGQRIEFVRKKWHAQDQLLARRDRQIEENVRMLAGQQWSVWSRLFGRFLDLAEFLEDRERKWRRYPVVNRTLLWFMMVHARMTENPPIIGFKPATGDRYDSELAQVMDTIWKTLWEDTEMLEVLDRVASWLIPGGVAHWKSRVDPNRGDVIEWRGPAVLQMEGDQGLIERVIPDAPFGQDGEARVAPNPAAENGWEVTGPAFSEYEGGVVVDPISPLQVRGQWGPTPWHRKSWHIHRDFFTPEEVWDSYQIEVEPEITGDEAERIGELRRVLFGSGFYGSASAVGSDVDGLANRHRDGADGFVDVLEYWHRPAQYPGMQDGPETPGGRLLTVSRNHVLRDGPRPCAFPHTSPIRSVEFVSLPGRPSGSTPQEALNPMQRTTNRGWQQILEHRDKSTNPIMLYDKGQGINEDSITNEPGQQVGVNMKPSIGPAVEFVKPPSLGEDVYRVQVLMNDQFDEIGALAGALAQEVRPDISGEQVKEQRFNADRFLGPTMRRWTLALGRTAEDWQAILPTIWDQEKTLTWAGEDQVLRTITVAPDLFRAGKVNVVPDLESMLPESPGERRARAKQLWREGAYGEPSSPAARRRYFEEARFSHMSKMHRPGGVHRLMAEHENGRLAQGLPADQIPILAWQDHDEHIRTHEEFMAGPDYQKLPVPVQEEFARHWEHHHQARFLQAQQEMAEQLQLEMAAQSAMAGGQGGEDPAEGGPGPDTGPPDLPRGAEAPAGRPPGSEGPAAAAGAGG